MPAERKEMVRADPPWFWPAFALLAIVYVLLVVYGVYNIGYNDGLARICHPANQENGK